MKVYSKDNIKELDKQLSTTSIKSRQNANLKGDVMNADLSVSMTKSRFNKARVSFSNSISGLA